MPGGTPRRGDGQNLMRIFNSSCKEFCAQANKRNGVPGCGAREHLS